MELTEYLFLELGLRDHIAEKGTGISKERGLLTEHK